jgi:hypothetical protein
MHADVRGSGISDVRPETQVLSSSLLFLRLVRVSCVVLSLPARDTESESR